jgi:hypothetical protein
MENRYNISFFWDNEAEVWIASSEDVYGLILEDESLDNLMQRVFVAIPDLLGLEGDGHQMISVNCVASRNELVYA